MQDQSTTLVVVKAVKDIPLFNGAGVVFAGTQGRIREYFGSRLKVEFDGVGDVLVSTQAVETVERIDLDLDGMGIGDTLTDIIVAQQTLIARLQDELDAAQTELRRAGDGLVAVLEYCNALRIQVDDLTAQLYQPAPVRIARNGHH